MPAELPLSGQHIDVTLEYIHPRKANTLNIFFAFSGPGLVTAAADTYSQAGAQFGYGLLWTVFLTTSFMIAIQLVSAHIGRVTRKGSAANAKQFCPLPVVLALVGLLVAAIPSTSRPILRPWARPSITSSGVSSTNTL